MAEELHAKEVVLVLGDDDEFESRLRADFDGGYLDGGMEDPNKDHQEKRDCCPWCYTKGPIGCLLMIIFMIVGAVLWFVGAFLKCFVKCITCPCGEETMW
eukprot:CAMPEP_0114496962 /NCGR_PEP_ID=MMETSP0109-20121206/6055_1 /TAXON_ID=29199 /ORGANISM="Chlorarachnion reptans, Strain CCCM449" /LENGTH=99 /DNA_ID=CAMNT_0001674281 /DNA_START=74 /DNA_END=370 /DNA_ORIENTATION=+